MPSTTRCRRGDIVLVAFPFTDLTSSKEASRAGCIDGILPKKSIVKPAKLFTMHTTLVVKKICTLGPLVRKGSLDRG